MFQSGYSTNQASRLSRRRVLLGAATFGAAAAFLAACGSKTQPTPNSGNLHVPVDTTKQAKRGGTLKDARTGNFEHLDALISSAGGPDNIGRICYSCLLKIKPGYQAESSGEVEGDLAEGFEVSPDGLELTMKLRPNAKWDQRAPTNGRVVDADDIVWSWNKFSTLHNQRGNLANSVSPDGVISTIRAVDKSTVSIKLAKPDSGILTDLANTFFYIQPREAASGFDPKTDVRGSGAWMVDKYDAAVGISFKRNPNWYISDRPFIDTWESPIVPEYVTRLSQFKAGNIYATPINQDDLLATKKDVPDLLMTRDTQWNLEYWAWQFSWSMGTIFEDDRIRKALSRALDRELILGTFSNKQKFADQGLEVATRWNSHIPAGYTGWWIDPQTAELGPGAEFFKYDVAEAKLLAAAGYPSGLEVPATTSNLNTYQLGMNQMLVHLDMMSQAGIRTKFKVIDHLSDFRPNYQGELNGDFPGIITIAQVGGTGGARGSFLRNFLLPGGGISHGFYAKGNYRMGDPEVTKTVNQIRGEFDEKKQEALAKNLQKYLATQMYYVPWPGVSLDFALSWPVIGNYDVYRSGGRNQVAYQTANTYWWIDASKAPLKKPAGNS